MSVQQRLIEPVSHRVVSVKSISDQESNRVDVLGVNYRRMAADWRLLDDLWGSTPQMKKARTRWLPQEPEEGTATYNIRIERSVLYEGWKDTVQNLAQKPFSRPVNLAGELPAPLDDIAKDVNRQGTDITQFAAEVFEEACKRGLTFIYVDFPVLVDQDVTGDGDDGGARPITLSRAQEEEMGVRPTFIHYSGDEVIGYRADINQRTGVEELTQVRLLETRVEDKGKWGDVERQYIRVVNAPSEGAEEGTWELWRHDDDDEWRLDRSGTHTFPGIPLIPVNINPTKKGVLMQAEPPLMKLAWLNLRHWQFASDQGNTYRVAMFPMLFASGLTASEMRGRVAIGPTKLFKSRNKDAKMQWVESAGSAIAASEEHLEKLEMRMEVMGLEPLVDRVQTTATGKVGQDMRRTSAIQSWIRVLEAALEQAYEYASLWLGNAPRSLPEDFAIDIFNDFGITVRGVEEVATLVTMREKKQISHETFLREMKRRAVLSDQVDIDEELEKIEAEGPDPMEEMQRQLIERELNADPGDPNDEGDPFGDDEDEA